MEKDLFSVADAVEKLDKLVGQDLELLGQKYGITIKTPDGKINKGWVGQLCEKYLGADINSKQEPDFGDWELKSVYIKPLKRGGYSFKETLKITMIDPDEIVDTSFGNSHLYYKIKNMLVVGRLVIDNVSTFKGAINVEPNEDSLNIIEEDYQLIKNTIKNKGFHSLTSRIGTYVQARTAGPGNGSTSRAFYAKKLFLNTHCKKLL